MNFKRGDRVVVNGEQDGVFFRDESGVVERVMSATCEIQFDDWFNGWGDDYRHWNVAEERISFWTEEENNPPPDISIKLETLFET